MAYGELPSAIRRFRLLARTLRADFTSMGTTSARSFWKMKSTSPREESSSGIQFGAVNWTPSATGFQVGAINATENADGVQLGAVNWADSVSGLQIGGFNRTETLTGVQLGAANLARGDCFGVQLGAVNLAGYLHGLQLGAFNLASSGCQGAQIGLINIYSGNRANISAVQFGGINAAGGSAVVVLPVLRIVF